MPTTLIPSEFPPVIGKKYKLVESLKGKSTTKKVTYLGCVNKFNQRWGKFQYLSGRTRIILGFCGPELCAD